MIIVDLLVGVVILGSIYFEYEYFERREQDEEKETDPIERVSKFAIRMKSVTMIITGLLYFVARLRSVW